ncbi:MAG: response regulator, partial [Planctomycetota bacterium]
MLRALVVDDEPQVRDLTSRALARCRFDCDTAADGQEALELCGANDYHVVLTDIRMPRRHGHALAVELLSRPDPPHVVVLTGLAEPRLVRDLLRRGVSDVICKPVDYAVLAMKVSAVAERQRLAGQPPPASGGAPSAQATGEPAEPEVSPYQMLHGIEKSLAELTGIFQDTLDGVFDFDPEELNDLPKSVGEFITRFAQQEIGQGKTLAEKAAAEARAKTRVRCDGIATAVPVMCWWA